MSDRPADFRVEIIKARPQGIANETLGAVPVGDVVDITSRTLRDGFGSINRAVERDFLSFKTGDLTLSCRNQDGFFDDLFAFFTPTDVWGLRVYRRGEVQFYGCVIGLGSILFDRKGETVELTVYGLTKLLDLTSCDALKREFDDLTVTTATSGSSTLTISDTTDILPGDTLHLTSATASEDVTVRYVTSGTVLQLTAALVTTYASGSPVTVETPFPRYRSIDYLVEQLFLAAGVPIASLLLNDSGFALCGPSLFSHGGLGTTNIVRSTAAERNGRIYVTVNSTGTYYQPIGSQDEDWVQEDATQRPWIDWSRYRKESEGAPTIVLRHPDVVGGGVNAEEWMHAVDDRDAATKYLYRGTVAVGPAMQMQRRSSTDGTTWGAFANFGAAGPVPTGVDITSTDFDPVRNQYLVCMDDGSGYLYDAGLDSWTSLGVLAASASPTAEVYPRYIPERDYFLIAYEATGGVMKFAAWRGTAKIWDRTPDLPRFIRVGTSHLGVVRLATLAQRAREVQGRTYFNAMQDAATCLISSDDDWQTARIGKVVESIYCGDAFGGRVGGAYIFTPSGSSTISDRKYQIAAPFFAGVIEYADFEDLSTGEALKKLATISNSLFEVDDDLQGRFIARDLYDTGQVLEISDRVKERSDSLLWEETSQFVTVSGGDTEATAGDNAFAADGVELDSSLVPNEAFAQSLAQDYYEFYSQARTFLEITVHDPDGHVYRPLDRVTIDGVRYLVYESDHMLLDDEVALRLLEDR